MTPKLTARFVAAAINADQRGNKCEEILLVRRVVRNVDENASLSKSLSYAPHARPSRFRAGELQTLQEALCLSLRNPQITQNFRRGRRLGDMHIAIHRPIRLARLVGSLSFQFLAAHIKSCVAASFRVAAAFQ